MKLLLRFCLVIGCSVTGYTDAFAQLEVRSTNRQPIVNHSIARIVAIGDTLSLPFWDDFSYSHVNPDSSKWDPKTGVLINGTIGSIAPSINVISFDGNNASGEPYNSDAEPYYDSTDSIESQPINLAVIEVAKRSSVYLSFYWQMKGLGEIPEESDSLILYFRDTNGSWVRQWFKNGIASNLSEVFKEQRLSILDAGDEYFHEGFKFKFVSKGNTAGPFDAWHVDYVYLNQDRSLPSGETREPLLDRAIAGMPSSIFGEYTMIPHDVIFNFPDTIYKDVSVQLSNFANSPHPVQFDYFLTNYQYLGTDSATFETLYPISKDDGNLPLGAYGRNSVSVTAINSSNLLLASTDSILIQSEFIFKTGDKYFYKSINGSDTTFVIDEKNNYRLNDTVRRYHEVHHALAYDDGVAEFTAGLNKNRGMFAIKFNIPSQDTLTHVDIYFPRVVPFSTGKQITLSIYKDLSGEARSVLAQQEYAIGSSKGVNQFSRFTFETPAVVSGEFYVVFQQGTNDYIGIGLDNNNLIGKNKIWVNIDEKWEPNQKVEGILMIRPIFKDSDYVVASVTNDFFSEISFYPNPVSETITIVGKIDRFEMYNFSGQLLLEGKTNKVDVNNIGQGIYLMRTFSGGKIQSHKVIVAH